MAKFVDVKIEYAKDKNLKKEDVKAVVKWVKSQPHLPEINDFEAIAFLKKNDHHIEPTKKTIETFFTLKKLWPDIFGARNFATPPLKGIFDAATFLPLPKKTPEGYTIYLMKVLGPEIINYDLTEWVKFFDMTATLHLYLNGTSDGYHFVTDMKNVPYAYLPKVEYLVFKRYFHFMEEVMPQHLKGVHFITHFSWLDEFASIVRAASPKAMLPKVHVHNTVEDFEKYIPLELLPVDYGGSEDPVDVLKEKWEQTLLDNADFFEWESQQFADEDRRPSKLENAFEVEKGLSAVF